MQMQFTKMQGLGNDFLVLDATRSDPGLSPEVVRRLGDRRRGVGFDQLLVAEPACGAGAALRMRIYNADGSRAEQCGNGLRCFARFARQELCAELVQLRLYRTLQRSRIGRD